MTMFIIIFIIVINLILKTLLKEGNQKVWVDNSISVFFFIEGAIIIILLFSMTFTY